MSFSAAGMMGAAGIAALGSIASGAVNGGFQFGSSKSLAKYNYELGQRSLLTSPGNYKKGLIKAGINPILASGSPIGATQGSSGVNPGVDLVEGFSKFNSARNLNAQTKSNIDYQTKQGDAAIAQADASSAQAEASMITAQANAEKAKAEADYSRALTQTENAIREEKINAKGREGKNSVFNTVEDFGKKITNWFPAERPDSGIIHNSPTYYYNSAKSVPDDPNKTFLKGKSQEEKEKYYLEQIRKRQKYIRSK